MFNIGGGELLAILVIALIVLGPTRLPDAARTIGKTMGELRRLSSSFQNEVRSALDTTAEPDQVTSRRDVLGGDQDAPPAPEARPPRRKPLVAAPEPAAEPGTGASQAPSAAEAAPKNGAAVQKPSAPKAPAPRTDPS